MPIKNNHIDIKNIIKRKKRSLLSKENVIGAGQSIKRGEDAIAVFVQKKVPLHDLKLEDVIPSEIEKCKTDVIEIGDVYAQDELIVSPEERKGEWRPCPPGVSIGHYRGVTGTFGCVVFDKEKQKFILSNAHILADDNAASIGDDILQPGLYDQVSINLTPIAKLSKYVPLVFEGEYIAPPSPPPIEKECPFAVFTKKIVKFILKPINFFAKLLSSSYRIEIGLSRTVEDNSFDHDFDINLVDCAIGKPLDDNMIIDKIVDGPIITGIIENPNIGLYVAKSGRTTGLTYGEVVATNVTMKIYYGNNKTCIFENQIMTTYMSEPGDSGSLVWSGNKAVGLLFAGSSQITLLNPIKIVLDKLKVSF